MYRSIPVANRLCNAKWEERKRQAHLKKLKSIKASVDNKPPKRYLHLAQRLKKAQLEEERYLEIEHENQILLEKMSSIMHSKTPSITPPPQPRSLNRESRRKELMKIMDENQHILRRIQQKEPYYNHRKWLEERKKTEKILDNICYYPPSLNKGRVSAPPRVSDSPSPSPEKYLVNPDDDEDLGDDDSDDDRSLSESLGAMKVNDKR